MQARFWIYHNGAVRLKLAAGQTVTHRAGGATDEGWNVEVNSYSFDGRTVTNEWLNDGVDCDGRMTRAGVTFCDAAELGAGYRDEDGTVFPKWQHGEQRQRDYSAEAAGY